MNKIKIITTIVLFFNVVFSSFIVFAESNYPIATVDNKFCYTMSDVTQNCKDGSVITFLDDLNYDNKICIPANNVLITSNGIKTIKCDYLDLKGDIKLENINLITHDGMFNLFAHNVEIGENTFISSDIGDVDLFSGKETIIRSGSFGEVFGGMYEGDIDYCSILIDGKETKIEKINGTYHSNYINNFNCEINNGYIKEIDTKKVKDSAVIALNGGKVDDIIYGSANNTDIIFDNYNNKVNSLKYNTPNNLNITIKSGFAEIEFLPDKFHLVVEDEGKIIINGKTYLKGIYEIDSVVDGFTDLKNHWSKDYIDYSIRNGILKGIDSTTFGVDTKMTRGMAINALHSVGGKTYVTIKNTFDDISSNDVYYDSIQWAYDKGIISKSKDNKFRPNDNITKEEFAVMLYQYLKYRGLNIVDNSTNKIYEYKDYADISKWSFDAMAYMVEMGIYNGDNNNLLKPKDDITKCELAVILKKVNSLIS